MGHMLSEPSKVSRSSVSIQISITHRTCLIFFQLHQSRQLWYSQVSHQRARSVRESWSTCMDHWPRPKRWWKFHEQPHCTFQLHCKALLTRHDRWVFNGHTHKDSQLINYDNKATNSTIKNTTNINYNAPLNVDWVGPSIVPRTNYNVVYSVYQVDSKTLSVVNSQTYFANISNSLV